jgi:lysophospholipase L1-like esterase
VDVPNWPYDGPAQLADTIANDRPDVVILAFGTNDLRFAYSIDDTVSAYQELVAAAEQTGAFVLIALTPPLAPWYPDAAAPNPLYEALNQRLALTWPPGRLVDCASFVVPPGDYLDDGIHFSVAGHAKRAFTAYERLLFAD